jgi:hypothetical protein
LQGGAAGEYYHFTDAEHGTLANLVSEAGTGVNYLIITNAAAGAEPSLETRGSDTDVDLKLTPKGSGRVISSSDVVLPKTSGNGFRVDTTTPTYPWHDLLGAISIRGVGATDPAYNVYRGGIRGYQFNANNEVFIEFHLPHDYAPGTHLYIHSHWSINGTTRAGAAAGTVNGGTVTWGFEVTYAKGHNQAAFAAPITTTTVSGTVASTLYQHYIDEVQLSATSPTASQLDSDDIEVDGLILVRVYLSANNITVASGSVPAPFLHFADIHYQSTCIGTKAKAPNFYV